MNIVIMIILVFIFILFVASKRIEQFTADEAVKNVASLYNQGNLTVTQVTTPTIVGQNNALKITGNVNIPGQISSPSLDTINSNLTNLINAKVTELTNQINDVKGNLVKCNWNGRKFVNGDKGCEDDYWLDCNGTYLTGFIPKGC